MYVSANNCCLNQHCDETDDCLLAMFRVLLVDLPIGCFLIKMLILCFDQNLILCFDFVKASFMKFNEKPHFETLSVKLLSYGSLNSASHMFSPSRTPFPTADELPGFVTQTKSKVTISIRKKNHTTSQAPRGRRFCLLS